MNRIKLFFYTLIYFLDGRSWYQARNFAILVLNAKKHRRLR